MSAGADPMQSLNKPEPEFYTEAEASRMLGISVARLRMLLDENVFNDGSTRPVDLKLRSSDLVIIQFWDRTTGNPKVLRMPKRVQ